jgi:hypothetical protein
MSTKPGVTRREKGSPFIQIIQLFIRYVSNYHRSVRNKDIHIPKARYFHNNPSSHEEEQGSIHEGL